VIDCKGRPNSFFRSEVWIFVKTKVLATKSNAKSGFDQENFSIIVSGISLEDPGAKLS